jgi:hypothetical protein
MSVVARLVTIVDIHGPVDDARRMSLSARHEAVLADGRHVLLLNDRGWASSLGVASGNPGVSGDRTERLDIWAWTSIADVEETARVVVGPDEPFDGHSHEDMARDHWAALAGIMRGGGVAVDARELRRLPHEVVLTDRLLARLGRDPDGPVG